MQKIFILLMFVAMIFWGLSWPTSKILSSMHSPFIVAFGRFSLVALCLLPIIKFYKLSLKIPKNCLFVLFINVLSNASYSLVFFYAINFGNAGSAGIITTTLSPIIATVLNVVIFKSILNRREILGLFIGLISGIVFLSNSQSFLNAFNLFFILAAFLWACVTLSARKLPLNPLVLNFYSAFFSSMLFIPFLQCSDFTAFCDAKSLFLLLVIAILSTVFGTSVYYKSIIVLGVVKASCFTLLVPLFALILSIIILGESVESSTIFGGFLAVVAIYLISLYDKKHWRFLSDIFKRGRNGN